MFQGRSAGFTLIELLWALAILAVLLNISLGFGGLIQREQRYSTSLELRRLIGYARGEAVSRQTSVTLCALDSAARCTREWSGRDVAVYIDSDDDRRASTAELLRIVHWGAERGQVQWRAALGRPHLVFSPFGSTYQNGSFYLCYGGSGQPADLVLTINRGGRPYLADPRGRRCS